MVDVREVAEAHLRAGFLPEANGRYILSAHNTDFPEMAAVLRRRFGKKYPIPRRTLPKAAVWLVGPVVNKTLTRKFVSRNVNHPWRADTARSRDQPGTPPRSLAEHLNEFFPPLLLTVTT